MKTKILLLTGILFTCVIVSFFMWEQPTNYHPEFTETSLSGSLITTANAYPPAVGILGNAKNCMSCHVSNGPWNENQTIIDIIDKSTGKSLRDAEGNFSIEVPRYEAKTLVTIIGREKGDGQHAPYRNAWLFIDPTTIGSNSLSKFAPGWETNLPMSCRIVGDKIEGYDGASITALPMTIRATDAARAAELQLQVMLTKGESIKGKAAEGIVGNYFERKVKLIVKN
jgi:hypothetical protein